MIRYRIELEPDDNDTLLVTSPDLPIVTYGDDEASALVNAVDAAQAMLASYMADREDIPVPNHSPHAAGRFIQLPMQVELKVLLYQAMKDACMTRADLQRRLKCNRETVDRLFKLNHNSQVGQIDDAFRAIDCSVDIQIRSGSNEQRQVA